MGRTKRQKRDPQEEGEEGEEKIFSLQIHGDAKRSIAAVFLCALAILFILGFLDYAGALGTSLDVAGRIAFGWGKWLLPVVLIIAAVVLLHRAETFFYVTRLIGLGIFFWSILGFFHLYFDPAVLSDVAHSGRGGGYAGYALAQLLIAFTGVIAGSVVLAAGMVIGSIIAFNFSLAGLFQKMRRITPPRLIVRGDAEQAEENDMHGEEENLMQGEESVVTETQQDDAQDGMENMATKKKSGAFRRRLQKKVDGILSHKEEGGDVSDAAMRQWALPPVKLLYKSSGTARAGDVRANAVTIEETLRNFGIDVTAEEIITGPTVTQYSFRPASGVKLSRITALSNDLALALAAHPIRIEAPIPGKSLIGIEVPNKAVETVRLRELLEGTEFASRASHLSIALGKDVSGAHVFGDLKKMPHLLVAGATGAGKSVCVNGILLSLLYQNSPEKLKLILVDPKRVELSLYNGIPHLLTDVIVDNNKVLAALKWAVGEMERRYKFLQETGSRDLPSYNQKISRGEHGVNDQEAAHHRHLPYIVIVIDELADLMSSHGKEVEGAIVRLAQMARAVGIHLIVSTQRPSVEVLTGLIKANITTRIALKVATQIDSRTILDGGGAEKLVGNGDMLYTNAALSKPKRLQGVFVTEEEVKRVVDFIVHQNADWRGNEESGDGEITTFRFGEQIDLGDTVGIDPYGDALYDEAQKIVIAAGKASTSMLQRRLRVGYSRAARLIDMLEERGVVGSADGAKPRDVLVQSAQGDPVIAYENPSEDQETREKWQM